MFKKKSNEKNTYGIVGLGRFGHALALELAAAGAELVVLDKEEEKVRELREYTENAYVVHALDKKTLSETGVQNCDVAVVCIGEQLDISILTTLNLVSLGVPTVIFQGLQHGARGNPGKDRGPGGLPGARHGSASGHTGLEAVRMLDFIQLSEKLNISKMIMPERSVGKTVVEANLRGRFGVNIIAVENEGKLIETITPDYAFKKGDIAYISGSKEALNRLSEWNGKA